MKRILLLWYQEGDNFGDTLIADTSHNILTDCGYEISDCEIGSDPSIIIKKANECDFLLFAGGGIIERDIPPILQRFYEYAELLNVPYGVIGLSTGNFDYSYKSMSLGRWCDEALFFYTRDVRSAGVLNRFAKERNVKASADCVFANKKVRCYKQTSERYIGASIRDIPYIDITGDFKWEKLAVTLMKSGVNTVLPDESVFNQEELFPFFTYERDCYLRKNKKAKVDFILKEIGRCKFLVSMRYHIILTSACMGIPSVPLVYCPKILDIAQQLGLQHLAVDPFDYNGIEEKSIELMRDADCYKKKVADQVVEKSDLVIRMYDDVVRIIGDAIG